MNGVDKMLYIQSTNANDGTMTLTVTFDVESEVNIDQVNAQNRVSQAQPNLPTDVNQFGITYRSTVGLPLLVIAIYSPNGTYDSLFLGNYALINVNDALYRVPGVGQVVNFGLAEYSMRIWVKADKLAKLGITVPDLVRAVQQQSAVNPAGRVGARAGAQGPGADLHRARPGTARDGGGVRPDRGPHQPDGLGGATARRGAHGAGRAQLQPVRPLQRAPLSPRRRVPGSRGQRLDRRERSQGPDAPAQGALPERPRLPGRARHQPARSPRG